MTTYLCSIDNVGEDASGRVEKELYNSDPVLLERFKKAEDQAGRSVYECLNPLEPGARKRNLTTVAELRRIYFDLDLQNIVESPEESVARLARLPIEFSEVRDSGNGNLHLVIEIKDPPLRKTPEYDRLAALWKRLGDKFAADSMPTHPAALIRCVGTHNRKDGHSGLCRKLNGDSPLHSSGRQLDITELEALDDLLERPLLTRKEKPADSDSTSSGGERSGPVDHDAEWAALEDGKSANAVHCRIIPSLLRRAIHPEDVLNDVVDKTMAMAERCRLDWTRDAEIYAVKKRIMCAYNLFLRDYDSATGVIPVWLPGEFHEAWARKLLEGRQPFIGFGRGGFDVRSKGCSDNTASEGEREPEPEAEAAAPEPPNDTSKTRRQGWSYYDSTEVNPPRWLIKQLLPESGVGIMSGQWGRFKTTAALDLSVAVMTGQAFAEQYRVKRPGAVLYFATEGAGTLQSRLAAIARHRGAPEKLPFAWRGDCPLLTDKGAGQAIVKHVDEAAARFEHTYGVPITLIWVDTYITAAVLSSSGDDNDTAATQKAFNTLRFVAAHSGAFVATIDHLGKVVEAGHAGLVWQRRQCRHGAGHTRRARDYRCYNQQPDGCPQTAGWYLRLRGTVYPGNSGAGPRRRRPPASRSALSPSRILMPG